MEWGADKQNHVVCSGWGENSFLLGSPWWNHITSHFPSPGLLSQMFRSTFHLRDNFATFAAPLRRHTTAGFVLERMNNLASFFIFEGEGLFTCSRKA